MTKDTNPVLSSATAPGLVETAPNADDLRPTGLYTVREAAAWLRISNFKAVYEIAESELPRCRVGPNRGRIRFLGADLLCYARSLPPIDVRGVLNELKDRLSKPRGGVTPMGRGGIVRVL